MPLGSNVLACTNHESGESEDEETVSVTVGEGLCRIHTPNFSLPTLATLILFPSTVQFFGHCLKSLSILGPARTPLPFWPLFDWICRCSNLPLNAGLDLLVSCFSCSFCPFVCDFLLPLSSCFPLYCYMIFLWSCHCNMLLNSRFGTPVMRITC
jgi:hypothetical protein